MELLIAMAITALVLTIGVKFLQTSFRDFRSVSKEYALQNGVRSSIDNIEKTVKGSTALFTVDKKSFDPIDPFATMKPEWNYIGMSSDQKKLINYVWISKSKDKKDKKGFHKEIDITPVGWNIKDATGKEIKYKIGFYEDENWQPMDPAEVKKYREEKKMVKIQLEGQLESTESKFRLNRDIIAVNAAQVLDSRKNTNIDNPITALAYRSDDPQLSPEPADAAVVFVVDLSTSMNFGMNTLNPAPDDQKRLTILKKNAEQFIGELESAGKIDLYFVPFSTCIYGLAGEDEEIERLYINQFDLAFQGENWGEYNVKKISGSSKKNAELAIEEVKKLFYQNPTDPSAGYRRTFTNPAVQKRVDDLFNDIEKKVEVMNGIATVDSQTTAKRMVEASRDALRDCIELMQQPFNLDYRKPQAAQAKDFIYNNLRVKKSGVTYTNTGGGLREGYKLLKRSNKKVKYLVLLSDGYPSRFDYQGENVGHLTHEALKESTLKGIPINPDDSPEDLLNKLKKSLQQYCYTPKSEYLPDPTPEYKGDYTGPKKAIKAARQAAGVVDTGYKTGQPGDQYIKLNNFRKTLGGTVYTDRTDYVFPGDSLMIKYVEARDKNKSYTLYVDDRYERNDNIPQLAKEYFEVMEAQGEGAAKQTTFYKLYEKGLYRRLPEGIGPIPFMNADEYYPSPSDPNIPVDPKNPEDPNNKYVISRDGHSGFQYMAEGGAANLNPTSYAQYVMTLDYNTDLIGKDYLIEKTFLIGFSGVPADKTKMEALRQASENGGCSRQTEYLDANTPISLAQTFSQVAQEIKEGMWFFEGP